MGRIQKSRLIVTIATHHTDTLHVMCSTNHMYGSFGQAGKGPAVRNTLSSGQVTSRWISLKVNQSIPSSQ